VHVTVILPTYNELENIVDVLTNVKKAVPSAAIMVVDDGSPDGTADLAQSLADDLGGIEVIRRSSKNGLGSAYRFAFERVFALPKHGDDDIVVTMDSDLSHDAEVIPAMIQMIAEGADAVIGSRYVEGGGTENWPLHRRLLSRWGNRYTGWILEVPVKDCTSGFRSYRLGALQTIRPETTSAEGYAFLTELVVRLSREGYRVEETPILFVDRTAGTSKMSRQIIIESMTLVTRWGLSQRLRRIRRSQS
jgi:dolichol-phosphate mannosyltransferase